MKKALVLWYRIVKDYPFHASLRLREEIRILEDKVLNLTDQSYDNNLSGFLRSLDIQETLLGLYKIEDSITKKTSLV